MDVWAITVAVLRRWYVFFPLLAVTLLAAVWFGDRAPEQYEVTSTSVLVPGTEPTEIENPYGGIGETAQVLEIVLSATATRDTLEDSGLSPEYVVHARSQSRILDVSVIGDTPATSLGTAEALLQQATRELAARQGDVGIAEGAQVRLQVLQEPTIDAVVSDGRLRNMAMVGMLGGALSLLIAVLFDDILGLAPRWRQRRRHRGDRPSDVQPSEETWPAQPPGDGAVVFETQDGLEDADASEAQSVSETVSSDASR